MAATMGMVFAVHGAQLSRAHRLCSRFPGTTVALRGFLQGRDVPCTSKETTMAGKYSKKAAQKVKRAMHEYKEGTLRSGRSGRKAKSRKQAVAIGLSEARKEGAKVPRKRVKKSNKQ